MTVPTVVGIDQIYFIIFYLVEMVSTIVGTVIGTVGTVVTLVGTPSPNCSNDCPNCSGDRPNLFYNILFGRDGLNYSWDSHWLVQLGQSLPNCRSNLASLVQVVLAPLGMFIWLMSPL